jgi:5'(3')-deoxyribonucleotidase
MRIAIDLDGVLYDWEGTARFLLREYRDVDLPISTHWEAIKEAIPDDDWQWLWNAGPKLGLFRNGHMIKGAKRAFDDIKNLGHHPVLLTARRKSAVLDTLGWLAYHRFDFPEIHVLGDSSDKPSVPADIYIDDYPKNIWNIAKAKPKSMVICFRQSWNKNIELPREVWIADGWISAYHYIWLNTGMLDIN